MASNPAQCSTHSLIMTGAKPAVARLLLLTSHRTPASCRLLHQGAGALSATANRKAQFSR
eukprot:6382647-Alexandrium_andersonii.AAC.1